MMNKEQALSYGVREDAYRDFQEHVSRDVNKRAREMVERRKGGEAAFALAQLREAIGAMVRLIDDPTRLSAILQDVNSQYYRHRNDVASNRFNAQLEALKQEQPETGAGGAAGCP